IAPPARVTVITELSTVAGRSTLASCPCPRASNPTQSTAESTSGTPRICAIWSPREASLLRSIVSQPKLFACASRSGIMSPTITTAAPSRWQDAAQAAPAGPARSEEHTSELQSRLHLVCRLLLEKKKNHQLHAIRAAPKLQRTTS